MGDVVELRERRDRALADRAMAALQHPALRWVAGRTYYVAHRRNPDTSTAYCGAAGALVLAPPGVPLCGDCYRGGVSQGDE